jgi:hypothetical protein
MSDEEELEIEFVAFDQIPSKHRLEPSGDWLLDELRSLKALAGTLDLGPDRDAFVRAIQKTREAYERGDQEKGRPRK